MIIIFIIEFRKQMEDEFKFQEQFNINESKPFDIHDNYYKAPWNTS